MSPESTTCCSARYLQCARMTEYEALVPLIKLGVLLHGPIFVHKPAPSPFMNIEFVAVVQSSPELKWGILEGCKPMKLTTLADENDIVIINAQRLGFYRVKYSPELQRRLELTAGSMKGDSSDFIISSVDLAGMLDDAFNLARAGLQSFDVFLKLTAALGEWSMW